MAQEAVVSFEPEPEVYMPIDHTEVARVAILGVAAGLLVPLLTLLINNFFIEPVFCRSTDSLGVCSSGGVIAYHVAAVIVGMMAVALLANWGVFRPLLIVAAVTIAFWGMQKVLAPIHSANWLEYFAFSGTLFGLGYLMFYWLLRLKNFTLSLVAALAALLAAVWTMVA